MPANQDFDLSFLYEIADGSNEFIVDSIDMFLQQTPQLLLSISDAIEAGDWVVAGQAAHKLKPNLGFFGMLDSQATMQDIEILCKEGGQNPAAIKAKYNDIKAIVNNNLVKLAKIKSDTEALL
jgi:HPt (histidine-containing phosphotransfer) domain-containing protein